MSKQPNKWIIKTSRRGYDAAENHGHEELRGAEVESLQDALVLLFGDQFSIQPLLEQDDLNPGPGEILSGGAS